MAAGNNISVGKGVINPFAIAGNLFSGTVGLIGQQLQMRNQEKLMDKQNAWQEEMMDKQNQWNLDQWNRENEYNSPAEQAKRMADAGLNPLFAGLDGAGNASAMTSASPASTSMPSLNNPLEAQAQALNQMALQAAQIDNLKSQSEKTDAEKDKITKETDILKIEEYVKNNTKDNEIELSGIKVQFEQGAVEKQQEEIANLIVDRRKTEQDIAESLNRVSIAKREIALKEAALALQKLIADRNYDIEQRKLAVDWFNARSQAALNNANIELMRIEGDKIVVETDIAKIDKEVRSATKDTQIKRINKENEVTAKTVKFKAYVGCAQDVANVVKTSIDGICNLTNTALDTYATITTRGLNKIGSGVTVPKGGDPKLYKQGPQDPYYNGPSGFYPNGFNPNAAHNYPQSFINP